MLTALAEFGLDGAPPPSVTEASTLDEILGFLEAAESGYESLFKAWFAGLPQIENVETRTEVIGGVDGNAITLYVHRPKNISGPLPCVYHIHGGGMVILEAAGTLATRWREELCAAGLIVVGVEFRNGAGKRGCYPFPAGLNDCMSGLQWTFENKAAIDASAIVVSGESGGGNLSLAAALKAKVDGKLHHVDGVYAMCPGIANAWAHKIPELLSLYENDDYLLNCSTMGAMAVPYDPERHNDRNPLCWPYFATTSDLRDLPPHVVSVNELDPLRDEGLAYYRMLMAAGVRASSRTVNGTCHCGDMVFRKAMPDVFAATVRDIKGFADSLATGRET
jgi:acetyl esterase/lipase